MTTSVRVSDMPPTEKVMCSSTYIDLAVLDLVAPMTLTFTLTCIAAIHFSFVQVTMHIVR